VGGLFAAGDLLLAPLVQALRELAPCASVVSPRGTSLDGARILAADGVALEAEPGLLWSTP
jgi:hypothetical protein